MAHKYIVLDLETLGTKPGCPILSIGAAAFDMESEEVDTFYCKLHLMYQSMVGVSESTLRWWMDQSEAARESAFTEDADAQTIYTAHQMFNLWISDMKLKSGFDGISVWGNSSSFDNEILRASYERHCLEDPWGFRADRDFRTLRALYKEKVPEPEFIGIRHHAKYDAMHEAKWLKLILQRMKAEESAWRCQENARQEAASMITPA